MKLLIAALAVLLCVAIAPDAFSQAGTPHALEEHVPAGPEERLAEGEPPGVTPVQGILVALLVIAFVGTLVFLALRNRRREFSASEPSDQEKR
jgi:hypothetical protein